MKYEWNNLKNSFELVKFFCHLTSALPSVQHSPLPSVLLFSALKRVALQYGKYCFNMVN